MSSIHPTGTRLLLPTLLAAVLAAPATAQQGQEPDPARQERLRRATETGPRHQALARFVGEWDVEILLAVPGGQEQRARGHATYAWLISGRWLSQRLTDELFGQRHESFSILGYDSYAANWVISGVSSFDNALDVSRGPAGGEESDVIVTFGSHDDYVTGRLHKPYKLVLRITDADHHTVETWDLGAGLGGEDVRTLEYRYTRVR